MFAEENQTCLLGKSSLFAAYQFPCSNHHLKVFVTFHMIVSNDIHENVLIFRVTSTIYGSIWPIWPQADDAQDSKSHPALDGSEALSAERRSERRSSERCSMKGRAQGGHLDF